MSSKTLGLPQGTTHKYTAIIEIVEGTPTLIDNSLFTNETMHAIMDYIARSDPITR
jgi:hypothetical protein